MQKLNIDQKILDSLKTTVTIKTVKISEGGQEKSSNSAKSVPVELDIHARIRTSFAG